MEMLEARKLLLLGKSFTESEVLENYRREYERFQRALVGLEDEERLGWLHEEMERLRVAREALLAALGVDPQEASSQAAAGWGSTDLSVGAEEAMSAGATQREETGQAQGGRERVGLLEAALEERFGARKKVRRREPVKREETKAEQQDLWKLWSALLEQYGGTEKWAAMLGALPMATKQLWEAFEFGLLGVLVAVVWREPVQFVLSMWGVSFSFGTSLFVVTCGFLSGAAYRWVLDSRYAWGFGWAWAVLMCWALGVRWPSHIVDTIRLIGVLLFVVLGGAIFWVAARVLARRRKIERVLAK